MKFVFVDSFDLVWNGYSSRFQSGISGSHNAAMYLAEALAQDSANSVEIISTKNNLIEKPWKKVKYTNLSSIGSSPGVHDSHSSCDYLVLSNNLESLPRIFEHIQHFEKIIILTQNDLHSYSGLLSIPKEKVIIGFISEFAKTNVLIAQPFLKSYDNILLYNSIDLDDIEAIRPSFNSVNKVANSLCYFACIERGFKMVVEILKKLENYTLYTNTYYQPYRNDLAINDRVIITESSAKYNVLEYVANSRYFVYPLINLNNDRIHYDTFGYVVLEALLLGTVVIAPKIKVYEELFGNAVCYIETSDLIAEDDLAYWNRINANFGYPLIDRYVAKIRELDANEGLRRTYIDRGFRLAEKFSNIRISREFCMCLENKRLRDRLSNTHSIPQEPSDSDSVSESEDKTKMFESLDKEVVYVRPQKPEKTILTVFAGRRANIEVLYKYLYLALKKGLIDEVHLWNNTRNHGDEDFIKTISNLRRTSSHGGGNYVKIHPLIKNETFDIDIRATKDIHIKLRSKVSEADEDKYYEIVIGGWGNTRSIIRTQNGDVAVLEQVNVCDQIQSMRFNLSIEDEKLVVKKGGDILMTCHCADLKLSDAEISVKTGEGAVGKIDFEPVDNHGFYFMDTCERSWRNYYEYYTNEEYENSTILKCDDDIVFIDLKKLPEFIEFVKKNEYDLVSANVINNGVAAYFQQNVLPGNLIPKELMDLEYPQPNGFEGSLWRSGKKAEALHNHFISNPEKFIDGKNEENFWIKTRFSINFFGYKGKDWYRIHDSHGDDEHKLTVEFVRDRGFKNVLYTNFYVSHLNFGQQLSDGMNTDDLIQKYHGLYDKMVSIGRFD